MTVLTPANQLTLLRMLLIPAFVILVVYGHLGWALFVFATAGLTDALDGLIARRSAVKSNLGAWLDPMADKLLLVTTFVVLTLPSLDLANPLPLWLTILIISRDVVIILTVAIVNLANGPHTFRPSILWKDRHCDIHRHRHGRDVLQLPRLPPVVVDPGVYASLRHHAGAASTTSGRSLGSSTRRKAQAATRRHE